MYRYPTACSLPRELTSQILALSVVPLLTAAVDRRSLPPLSFEECLARVYHMLTGNGGRGTMTSTRRSDSSRAPKREQGVGGEGGGRGRGSQGGTPLLAAKCVVQLREQDSVEDNTRPWVIFTSLKKRHRMKVMIKNSRRLVQGE